MEKEKLTPLEKKRSGQGNHAFTHTSTNNGYDPSHHPALHPCPYGTNEFSYLVRLRMVTIYISYVVQSQSNSQE